MSGIKRFGVVRRMKVAIVFNGKNDMFEAYKYDIWFRLLPSLSWRIECGCSEDDVINRVKKAICGKLKIIRILDI